MKFIGFVRKAGFMGLMVWIALCMGACSSENGAAGAGALKFDLNIVQEGTDPLFVVPGQDMVLEYSGENIQTIEVGKLSAGWTAEVDYEASKIVLNATAEAEKEAKIEFKAKGGDGTEQVKELSFYNLNSFNDPNGAFVLNEGNMTTENGSLGYITPEGYVIGDAYKLVNGTELGNVSQDMAFCNGKIYVISQNGNKNAVDVEFENDGMLVVMDAKTLKKEKAFSKDELEGLDWPTHIAVLDEQYVYIRDNKGIYRLDMETKQLSFVEGSDGAPKSRFVVMGGKVYTFQDKGYMCYILEISPESDSVSKISLPYSAPYTSMYSIEKAGEGDVWLTAAGFGKYYVAKFNLATKELDSREIGSEPNVGSAGVSFCAKDNVIYYANGTTLYRMRFDEAAGEEPGEEEMLCDLNLLDNNAGLLYNGLAVHPVTGHVYANSIKSFPLFTTNQIWVFDFEASVDSPFAKYENYTHFPAGVFFYPEN